MKKSFLSLFLILLSSLVFAQSKPIVYSTNDLNGFDKEAARKLAQQRSPKTEIQKEYFDGLMKKYIAQKKAAGSTVINATQPYNFSYDANSKTANINLNPQSAYCPNMGFENQNFSSWTGDTWTLSGIDWTVAPIWTSGIVTQGANTPAQPFSSGFFSPTSNRHTVMTLPATVNNPPANCLGWDSIAINSVTHLSDIPFVSPFSGGVTCRLGNANTGAETERIRYTMNVSAQNSQITISYAVVLQNPPSHGPTEQPFFQINLYDQSGNPIPGCGNYQIDASLASSDTSFHAASVYQSFGSPVWMDPSDPSWPSYALYYKKWTMVSTDLTAYIGQNITAEFRSGDCSQSGHFGYAYIDASCGPALVPVNMCTGVNTQLAIAPAGYVSYQWFGPNSSTTTIPSPTGTNDTLYITNGTPGDIYYLTAISASGCTTHIQAVLAFSQVSIMFTNSTPSCPGGNSGTATVFPTGGTSYNYAWTNSSGTNVGNTQTATGLSPGTYSVHVTSTGCGAHDTTVVVGIAPPITATTTKNFCGSAAYLVVPGTGATNIQWYNTSGSAIPGANNDTLLVAGASNGQTYAVVYTQSGCVDSLRITLSQVSGGTLGHSNIQNVCVGASNGQAHVNLSTTAPPPYNFQMTGPGLNQNYNAVSTTSYTLTGLSYGSYTVTAFDGTCFYGDVFKIDTIPIPVYLTVAPKSLCSNDSAFINYVFAGAPPTQCQLSSSTCLNATTHLVGPANTANSAFGYPTPFGNFYTKMKAQYIYTASELTTAGLSAGKISSVAFNVTQIPATAATVYPDFNIGIGCTSQSTFSSFPAITDIIPGTVNVYSNANYPVTMGLNTFTFSQPYEWDGVSNIIIEVCFEFPGQVNYTQNIIVDQTTTTNYPTINVVSDYDATCSGLSSSGSYWTSSDLMRPVATFGWCSSVASPSMYTYSLNPNIGVLSGAINPPATTIIQPPSTTSYTFTTTSVVGGCSKKDTFTLAVVAPFNIVMPPAATFCSNDPASAINATFTNATTGTSTTVQATWTGSGISANNGTGSATFTPASAGSGPHTLLITAGGGCMKKDSVVYTVNPYLSAQLTAIGPFCIYNGAVVVPHAANGGVWTGPVNAAGLFTPSTAGVTSNLTPPYHTIKYVTNGGTPCMDSSSIQVQVFDKPLVTFTSDTTEGCAPTVNIQFTSNVSPSGGIYHWNFNNGQTSGAANPQNVYTLPGTYSPKLTYTDVNGCKDSVTKTGLIIAHPGPNASFDMNPDHTSILEPHIYFINTTTGTGNTWLWNIADFKTATTKNTDYEFAEAGLYPITLYVTNSFGCKDSVTEYIKVDPDNVFYVPSAFTPNFDGKNDVLMAEGFGIFDTDGFRMQVYDRWGSKVFESHDIYKGWDGMKGGQVVQEDVYIYHITYKDKTGKFHTKSGQVSLLK